MKRIKLLGFSAVILFLLGSCKKRISIKFEQESPTYNIEAEVHSFNHHTLQGLPVTFLHGKVSIKNKSTDTLKYFIDDYHLIWWGIESDAIYINGYPTWIRERDSLLAPLDSITYDDVYWTFGRRHLSRESLEDLQLIVVGF